jgi:hypothetical protein
MVTDGGITTTFQAGSGTQPALSITFFTCS